MTEQRRNFWLMTCALAVVFLYLLAPILQPFFIAAALAYMGNPAIKVLEKIKLPRTFAVSVVFMIFALILFLFIIVLLPVLQKQLLQLWQRLPTALVWFEQSLLPYLQKWLEIQPEALSLNSAKQYISTHLDEAKDLLPTIYSAVSRSGSVIVSSITVLLLIPVVTFYLMRDWEKILQVIIEVMPQKVRGKVTGIATECDEVLGAFMRGQLSVMFCLGLIYAVGLWIVGVDFALLLGIIAGAASIVPYLGLIVGLFVSGIAAVIQFQELTILGWVGLVFVIGQILEGVALTPLLVGDKIGLHPIAVIFAILAGGYLFGFIGVLIALPVAAVLMVVIKHFHEHYLAESQS